MRLGFCGVSDNSFLQASPCTVHLAEGPATEEYGTSDDRHADLVHSNSRLGCHSGHPKVTRTLLWGNLIAGCATSQAPCSVSRFRRKSADISRTWCMLAQQLGNLREGWLLSPVAQPCGTEPGWADLSHALTHDPRPRPKFPGSAQSWSFSVAHVLNRLE